MHCCKKVQFFVQSAQYLPIGVHLRFSGMREDTFYAKCGLSAECDGDGDGGDDGDDGDGGCILRKVWAECRV